MPVIQRISERTISYSWRACEQLCHSCVTACVGCVVCLRQLCGVTAELRHLSDCLVAFAADGWRHDCCAQRVWFFWAARVTNVNDCWASI
ncbi:hypothetical protein TNCV_4764951 [Trichonephila clavipes]|nr:hypothetical protein TNCV_4764951 [Trichonephila clavipes]